MKPDYSLLVLDLDGTLTNSKKEITPRTLASLLSLQERGVRLVLASGRPTYGIAPLAEQLRMREHGGFILSYNGGEIIDWASGKLMYKNLLPDTVLPALYEAAIGDGHTILSYEDEYIVTEKPYNEYVDKEVFLNKMKLKQVKSFLEEVRRPLPKCLIVGHSEQLAMTEARLQKELEGIISVYRSEPFFLECVPLGIDKARSLGVLLDELGLTRDNMVAMGDGFNDQSMIEFAGMGVAMANAQEPVKQAADFVTLSNDEDGVVYAVERLF